MSDSRITGPPDVKVNLTSEALHYAVAHIFLPVDLSIYDKDPDKDLSLANAACTAAYAYNARTCETSGSHWHRIARMLENLQVFVKPMWGYKAAASQLREMQTGDILAFLIESHNSAVILTKQENRMLLESFEVSPDADAVRKTAGSLLCSYPGFSVVAPIEIVDDRNFQSKLVHFFHHPDAVSDDMDSHLKFLNFLRHPDSATQDPSHSPTPHQQFITTLHHGILRGVNCTAGVPFITKRIRDEAVGRWRRSSMWLLIRVALQMSADRPPLGCPSYKAFMLFFICTIARDENVASLPNSWLHLMASKILRRLSKLGSSIPDWLSQIALEACACLREILDTRCLQLGVRSSSFRNPTQVELERDTRLSLKNSHEYICNALLDHIHEPLCTPCHLSDRRCGAIHDYLSFNGTFFIDSYNSDPKITLYDVEHAVQHGIDDWIACVTNVDDASAQLATLLDGYMEKARNNINPEDESIRILTGIELFIALDKLVITEIPLLADYSPEVPVDALERLLLSGTTHLHRLSRAYQYLSARYSQSMQGWSVFSDEFTKESFPVRYYDQSPRHQRLKDDIEENVKAARLSQSPFPAEPLHTKVVVFELQCPSCIRNWRSAAAQMLLCFYGVWDNQELPGHPLSYAAVLQLYFMDTGPPLSVQIRFSYLRPLCAESRDNLHYALLNRSNTQKVCWPIRRNFSFRLSYPLDQSRCSSCGTLEKYVNDTSHTSNEVLSAQMKCPKDLSLDEFLAFGQLRCDGGLLQWLNILQGLRSRTLNLRRCHSHFLLSYAILQVGPLDTDTGTWIWHQELQDPFFCGALLDELESLFVDVGSGSIDEAIMNNFSLLLTRLISSSPGKVLSRRAIALLRSVRRKTFNWTQELSYSLTKAPMNKKRRDLLLEMAITCRNTFNVDAVTLRQLVYSEEDVDAALSSVFFIFALRSEYLDATYRQELFRRDHSISVALEGVLTDLFLTNPSDYPIDLAVGRIFFSHKPSTNKWERLSHPKISWFTCRTEETTNYPSRAVHFNLFDGQLLVGGRPLSGLPREISFDRVYQEIFHDQGFFLVSSNLPGMDFTTQSATIEHKVHFSLRNGNLVVRAQCQQPKGILELIPWTKLSGDLPPTLVYGHVHWLNLSTRTIEIRPLEQLWVQSPGNWRIDCTPGRYRAYKGHQTIVDTQSPTWSMFSQCFEPISSREILVTTSFIESVQTFQVFAALFDYGLSFFINDAGELESHDFKSMVYDEDQSIGTLLSFENILVLRHKNQVVEGLVPRRVLVNNGSTPKKFPSNLRWSGIFLGPYEPLYHSYNVDTELGCLIGNGSLSSTQFLAFLHALTSFHGPDPLTCKTGLQEAFFLLQPDGTRSIKTLESLGIQDYTWSSSRDSPMDDLYREVKTRYYSDREDWIKETPKPSEERTAQRGAYLFSWNATSRTVFGKDSSYDGSDYWDMRISTDLRNPSISWPITLDQLLSNRPAPELPHRSTLPRDSRRTSSDNLPELDQLLSCFSTAKYDSPFQKEYIALLHGSAQHVRAASRPTYGLTEKDRVGTLEKHFTRCRVDYFSALNLLKKNLGPTSDVELALNQFGLWPAITPRVLLRCLASTSPIDVSDKWRKCLVSFALLISELQRARRLLRFALDDSFEEEYSKELENEGFDGWNPEDQLDSGNFLIRREQAKIAMEMISPRSGQNTVMQVNMGEGKSSIIIPIVAASLADGKQLARVIVPKALIVQMSELLIARLSGLANRPIYHLPFSRSEGGSHQEENGSQIDSIRNLMTRCMIERGILLVQPEHIVSLKLMAIEQQLRSGNPALDMLPKLPTPTFNVPTILPDSVPESSFVGSIFRSPNWHENHMSKEDILPGSAFGASQSASEWLCLQKWTDSHVRDILDESDEILHPRFQLIYAIGLEQHMDGYPNRWTIIQQVLRLVRKHVHSFSKRFAASMEYLHDPPGSFPHAPIERMSVIGVHLVSWITEDVMAGQLPTLSFQDIPPDLHSALRSFISDEDVLQVPGTLQMVEEYVKHFPQSNIWSTLLLLRGLLAYRILWFTLVEKRWRIDYGLVSQSKFSGGLKNQTMLAVPYRAKDMPVPNTQFSQPDVIIVLTCLSYYYGGLSEEQLRSSFEILLDEDDPTAEYALWTEDYDNGYLPHTLRTLREINLNPSEQWDKVIFPLFSRNQAAIDFYLSRVVFPQEAKEFPWKLSASSWDLAEERERVITGFSGTNDGKWLLPMSIAQRDLDHQRGTNAKVLSYLIGPENDCYMATKKEPTHEFLKIMVKQRPEIRVLLDVGAQILDLSNIQVVQTWLDLARNAAGAIYFNENDELMILMRNGRYVPMLSSSLSQQIDRCVVYLDHAHTRGTDIKLPVGSRAAVTLGVKLTKDRLMQGCMRMRKLGHGHSVMFFSPPEVDLSIRTLAGKDSNIPITTVDILRWTIHETWIDIRQQTPYWAKQGIHHKLKHDAWSRFCNDDVTVKQLSDVWLVSEGRSLEDLYAPRDARDTPRIVLTLDPGIHQRCKELGILSLPSTNMDEEQEREVHQEREREREVVKLPPVANPARHSLHPDVEAFVKSGIIPPLRSGSAFRPVFTTPEKRATRVASVWSPFIIATTDFCKTIELQSTRGSIDQYLRPVQWVLSKKGDHGPAFVLLSPFEVHCMLPEIRESKHVHLHVYVPRTSLRMKPSDDMKLYSIPPLPFDWAPPWALIDQLNLFAGQLYLRDYNSYLRLNRFLGTPSRSDVTIWRGKPQATGSLKVGDPRFPASPLPYVMALLVIRTRGRLFSRTHMGKIHGGQPLTQTDFVGPRLAISESGLTTSDQTPYDFESENISPTTSDVDCDPPDDPESPPLILEIPETSSSQGSDPELPRKRQCLLVCFEIFGFGFICFSSFLLLRWMMNLQGSVPRDEI